MTRAAQRPPVSVRYATDEEEAEARRRAAAAGLSLHAYIRRRTAGAPLRRPRASVNRDTRPLNIHVGRSKVTE